MPSKLETCVSTDRPGSPTIGDILFETNTNRLITYDGTDWRTYDSDGIAYSSVGATELHYSTGLWSSASATYYISTSPAMHFDATILDGADAGNNPANGVAISTWGDRSGNSTNYDATQASASLQPTFATSGPGSRPAVTWATDILDLATTWSKTYSCTMIYVAQSGSGILTNVLGYTNYLNQFWMVSTQNYICGATAGTVTTDHDVHNMYAIHRDHTSAEVFEGGGTSVYGPATRAEEMKVSKIGQTAFGGDQSGTISEILVFESALSTADLNVIKSYIANKYSLTLATFT